MTETLDRWSTSTAPGANAPDRSWPSTKRGRWVALSPVARALPVLGVTRDRALRPVVEIEHEDGVEAPEAVGIRRVEWRCRAAGPGRCSPRRRSGAAGDLISRLLAAQRGLEHLEVCSAAIRCDTAAAAARARAVERAREECSSTGTPAGEHASA